MQIVLSCAWLAAVAWLLFRAFRQRNALALLTPPTGGESAPVVVIVPARNESQNIGRCVESLMALQYPAESLHLVVVDDGSVDDTAEIAAGLAAKHSPRITLLHAPALPSGWKGKPHACWVGAQAAFAQRDAQWLCFIDADMRVEPLLMGSAVAAAVRDHIDLLTLAARHDLLSLAERLILPCGHYLLGFSQNLRRLQSPESTDVVASGQFMLARRSAYERTGGHAAVRASICEDLELARLFKRSHYRVQLQDGTRLLSTRMYTGWSTLWPGIAKNLTQTLGGPLKTLMIPAVAVVMAWAALLLPVAQGIECQRDSGLACIALIPALVGSAAVVALHIAGALHFRIPIWCGLLFPLGYTAGACIAIDSVRRRLHGQVSWKGRIYE
jgi:chlorobactene glucosyltransferase